MKPKQLILIILLACTGFLFQSGCEEQATMTQLSPEWFNQGNWPTGNSIGNIVNYDNHSNVNYGPKIAFEKVTHNFGNVGMNTDHLCEFRFKNIGNAILTIDEVSRVCGCTPFQLEKREFAPGEIGTLQVRYYAETDLGPTTKQLYINSNDPRNPKVTLTLQAKIITKVNYEPKNLNLLLGKNNGSCPPIEIFSVDKKPFSITHFSSTNNCVTADFDPSASATKFVLQPKVDMTKLEQTTEGRIEIGLTHPECGAIKLTVNTIPKYRVSPQGLIITNAEPKKPIYKKLRILNNYNEKFDLESISSNNNFVKVVSNSIINNGYELGLEITPPETNGKTGTFTEMFYVKVKDGENLEIQCQCYYSHNIVSASRTTARRGTSNYSRNSSNVGSAQTFAKSSNSTSKSSKSCPNCGPKEYKFNPKDNKATAELINK